MVTLTSHGQCPSGGAAAGGQGTPLSYGGTIDGGRIFTEKRKTHQHLLQKKLGKTCKLLMNLGERRNDDRINLFNGT